MKNHSLAKNPPHTSFLFFLAVVLSVLALIYRKPEAFTKPQFWAEDGTVFFLQYFQTGAHSIFTPYNGYLHLIPRIAAMLTFKVTNFEHFPLAYNITSLLIFLGIVFFIWKRTLFDPYTKFFMTLSLSLLPVGSEIALTLTNVQWYANLFIPLIFLSGYNKKYVVLDGIVLFLVSLTGPFSVIFFPAVSAIVWYRSRRSKQWKNERWLFFIYSLATVIHLLVILFFVSQPAVGISVAEKIIRSPQLLYRHMASPLGIVRLYYVKSNVLFGLLLLGTVCWIFACWQKLTKEQNHIPFFLMLVAILEVIANIHAIPPANIALPSPDNGSTRYFFGPCILFLWSVIIFSVTPGETHEMFEQAEKTSRRNLSFLLLFTYYTAILAHSIPRNIFDDNKWPEQAKKIENFRKGHLKIPINPSPWAIYLDK